MREIREKWEEIAEKVIIMCPDKEEGINDIWDELKRIEDTKELEDSIKYAIYFILNHSKWTKEDFMLYYKKEEKEKTPEKEEFYD